MCYDLQNTGPAPSPLGQMPPNDGMPGGPIPPGFFQVSSRRMIFFIDLHNITIASHFDSLSGNRVTVLSHAFAHCSVPRTSLFPHFVP